MASRRPPALWRIGKLPIAEIKERLQAASLSTTGTKQTLAKRLHVHLQSLATASALETASGHDHSSSSPFPASENEPNRSRRSRRRQGHRSKRRSREPRHPTAATPAVLAHGAKPRIDGTATVTAGITVADGKADISRRYRLRSPARGAGVLPAVGGAAAVIPAATAIVPSALREGTYHPSHGG